MPKAKTITEKKLIWVATITNSYGIEVYLGLTREGLDKQLADYCRHDWADIFDEPIPTLDSEIISRYFDCEDARDSGEFIDYLDQVEVK